ncbi:MAG: 50S ribosomal protein L18 [Runella slithyformis]|nr:MAG: 50S ribosomal protein L18 [Runella slithyformis]TAF98137.1 MAG: 50S ribosomal protein L18 [Runella sp.]TAG22603.1 MAG: 50S ribosomal protein L18 [Cytophagales bacterium]TAG41692.1 MAG: 50S ribosomal protein L18 [Cytophagia bacterium]TAE94329.1 MAG: 50S ribosomal protein L18 [Runella slithyformis]
MPTVRSDRRERIKRRIKKKIAGTSERPRLSVFRSNSRLYAQIIDDSIGKTLVSTSSVELSSDKKNTNQDDAKQIGLKLAEKAVAAGVNAVVFDRNGYLYHGKVKALAEGAREGGLKF